MENKENKETQVTDQMIINHIYMLRGQKVMIDHDLAALYQMKTSGLNRLLNRNISRLPADFMFRLDLKDYQSLSRQNAGLCQLPSKSFPRAFTENGIGVLSGLLKADDAVLVNIRIVRIFSLIRHILPDYPDLVFEMDKWKC